MAVQLLSQTSLNIVESDFTSHFNFFAQFVVIVAQKKGGRDLQSAIFYLPIYRGDQFIDLFYLSISSEWFFIVMSFTENSAASTRTAPRGTALTRALSRLLTTLEGCRLRLSSSMITWPLWNFMMHYCAVRSIAVGSPDVSLISGAITATFRPSLNRIKKAIQRLRCFMLFEVLKKWDS